MNEEIWEEYGVDTEGAARCDAAMELMMQAVRIAGPEFAGIVMREARFQLYTLPFRTEPYRTTGKWAPPEKP